jgi:hypothetical protein
MYALLSYQSTLPNVEDRLRALFGPLQTSQAFSGAHLVLLPNSGAFSILAASLRRLARETDDFVFVLLGQSPDLFDVVLPPSHPVATTEIPPSLAAANLAYWHAFGLAR